jgi:hypothetical protein
MSCRFTLGIGPKILPAGAVVVAGDRHQSTVQSHHKGADQVPAANHPSRPDIISGTKPGSPKPGVPPVPRAKKDNPGVV